MRATRRGVGVLTHLVMVGIPITLAVAVGCSSATDRASDEPSGGPTTTAVADVVVDADEPTSPT